jgi:hypothetical protein
MRHRHIVETGPIRKYVILGEGTMDVLSYALAITERLLYSDTCRLTSDGPNGSSWPIVRNQHQNRKPPFFPS